MGNRRRLWLLASLVLLACTDNRSPSPTVEGMDGPSSEGAVCATCRQRAGGETADFGAAPGTGGSSCFSVEAPLTPEVEQAFELEQLRAYLASPRVVIAEPREILPGQPELKGPIEIELRFQVGEFTYRMGERCNSISAPVELTVNVGNGLLSFSAKGGMFKQAGELHAFLYASTDLATVTGSYRPQVDGSRPHTGQVEVPIYVYPDQLRGSLIPELRYFKDEEHLTRWLEGKPPVMPGLAEFPDLRALVHLEFPGQRDCADHERPLAPDVPLDLLGGKSPEQLRREVADRLTTGTSIAAVWRDDSTTVVRVELSESAAGSVCARADIARSGANELVLAMPALATLRTEDGKIDMQLDKLSIALDSEGSELRWAMLRGIVPHGPGKQLDGWIRYSFTNGAIESTGIVQVLEEVTPGAGTYGDCVAFPPGSEWDTGQCRYRR